MNTLQNCFPIQLTIPKSKFISDHNETILQCNPETHPFTNPFQIFPEEIWEMIMKALDNSDDIFNMFTSFPELTNLSQGKQCCWLIGAVIPQIFPKYLTVKDIKSCRLVSVIWKNAVDTCFETHPNRIPYNRSVFAVNRTTETDFNYRNLPNTVINIDLFLETNDCNNILQCRYRKNPFLGRTLEINLKRGSDFHAQVTGFSEILPLLKIYGCHIWHLTFQFQMLFGLKPELVIGTVLQPLFKCLSFVTNLKSLKITAIGSGAHHISKKVRKEIRLLIETTSFPFKLDTLNLELSVMQVGCTSRLDQVLHRNLLKAFINHVKVKKLVILAHLWRKKYATLLPNLSELSVEKADKHGLKTILKDLGACANLRKLVVQADTILNMNEIILVLLPYQIESLEFNCDNQDYHVNGPDSRRVGAISKSIEQVMSTRICSKFGRNIVSSITSLSIHATPYLEYSFIASLPNLQYLVIKVESIQVDRRHYFESTEIKGFSLDLRKCLDNLYCQGADAPENFIFIWNQLPKLKMLTVVIIRTSSGREARFQYVSEYKDRVFRSYV